MKVHKIKIKIFSSGFTLIEALVAISILMVAIASPLTLAQKGLSTSELSRDQMIASFLAQDGLEAVKNIRDQNALNNSSVTISWLNGLNNCFCSGIQCNLDNSNAQYCNIDTTQSNLLSDPSYVKKYGTPNVNPLMVENDANGFLKYDLNNLSGGTQSRFSRYINISTTTTATTPAGQEAAVHVRVSWQSQAGKQNVDITDFIYNYSNNPNVQ